MPNALVQLYRQRLADRGQTDDREDQEITQELAQRALEKNNRSIFDQYPDFGQEYQAIRDANAPSLLGEVGRGLTRSTLGLGGTALAGVSLLTGSDLAKRGSQYLDQKAADPDYAPTIQTMDDIAPGERGASRFFDMDTLRYGIGKVGEVAPSLVEAVGTSMIGAAAGTAAAPGPGTIAGAAGGFIGKGLVKSAIRSLLREGAEGVGEKLLARGLIREATEAGVEKAIKEGGKEVTEIVSRQAAQLAARRGGAAAGAANSYLLSSGEIYNETDDRGLSLGFGLLAAIPDTILPAAIIHRMFPDVTLAAARESAKDVVGKAAWKIGTKLGLVAGTSTGEAATEWFQEGVGIAAKNIKQGKDPLDFSEQDFKQMREAAVTGAIGGTIASPALIIGGSTPEISTDPKKDEIKTPLMTNQLNGTTGMGATLPTIDPPKAPGMAQLISDIDALDETQKREMLSALRLKPTLNAQEQGAVSILTSELGSSQTFVATVPKSPVTPPIIQPTTTLPAAAKVAPAPVIPLTVDAPEVQEAFTKGPDAPPEKIESIKRNFSTPGVTLKYSLYEPIPGRGRALQIDIINPERTESIESTNIYDLKAAGFDVPIPPANMLAGPYTQEEIEKAILEAPRKEAVVAPALDQASTALPSAVLAGGPSSAGEFVSEPSLDGAPIPQAPAQPSIDPEQASVAPEVVKDSSTTSPASPAPVAFTPEQPIAAIEDQAPAVAAEIIQGQEQIKAQQPAPAEVPSAPSGISSPEQLSQGVPTSLNPAVPQPEMRRSSVAQSAIDAPRTQEFQTVVSRLSNLGAKVSLMIKEFFDQSVLANIDAQIQGAEQKLLQATEPGQVAELKKRIAVLNVHKQNLSGAQGVTYSPWQIAIVINDILSANTGNLVTLLHEAAESLTMRLTPAQRGMVARSIDATLAKMHERLQKASERTGVAPASESSATDLLAETLAQELTANGIDEAPSMAKAIMRWVRDLYYRAAMAFQRAFGMEPSPEMALEWYSNQLNRMVGGDYDFRFASIFDSVRKPTVQERVSSFSQHGGTPGGITDFLDPITGRLQQPSVLPDSDEAIQWNMEFQRAEPNPGKELAIPAPEAVARITSAGLKRVSAEFQKWHKEFAGNIEYDQFLKMAELGLDPEAVMKRALGTKFPDAATAEIGGDKMTKVMNDAASLMARTRMQDAQRRMIQALAKTQEAAREASDDVIAKSDALNRIEPNFRDAEAQEEVFKDRLKAEIRKVVSDFKTGLDVATTHGEMVKELAETEKLIEGDALPEAYQKAFNRILGNDFPLFQYMDAVAQLDLPLKNMTIREIKAEFKKNESENETLAILSNSKPLSTAIAWLARHSDQQMDQLRVRKMGAEEFLEIQADLKEVRNATLPQLRELLKEADEKGKATTARKRIQRSYLEARRSQRIANARVLRANQKIDILERLRQPIDASVAELQQASGGAMSDWSPIDGEEFTSKVQTADGRWETKKIKLSFKADGSAENGKEVERAIAYNRAWLEENKKLEGQREYERIKRQTYAIGLLDLQRAYPAAQLTKLLGMLDKWVKPIIAEARDAGGAASARIVNRMNKFAEINRAFTSSVSPLAEKWSGAYGAVQKSTGLTDFGEFKSEIYDQVLYFIGVNPGLEESAAIREATRMARRRLKKEPKANFNEVFAHLLRATKEANEAILAVAEKNGVFVEDARLGGDLRRAIGKGWITAMRGMRAGTVNTVLGEMQKAGWKVELTEFGDGGKKRVYAKPATFAALDPSRATNPQDRAKYAATLENTDLLRQVLAPYFTQPTIKNFIEPFIRKPGREPFSFRGETISQLSVQDAWEKSKGDIVTFIDNLGQELGVQKLENSELSAAAEFRSAMLSQFDGLYATVSKKAAAAKQDPALLWDQVGTKPHAMMDARLDDLMPPEFLEFAALDLASVQQTVGTIAFHGAFGRNGTGMEADVHELGDQYEGKMLAFNRLTATGDKQRRAQAKDMGVDYDDLKRSAERYQNVKDMITRIRSAYGVGNPAGPFYDMRGGFEVLSAMAGQVIDNPRTGFYDMVSIAMRPFAMRSLGPQTISTSARGYAALTKEAFGSLLQNFSIKLFNASDYAKDIGHFLGHDSDQLPWGLILSDPGKNGKFQSTLTDKYLIRGLRAIKAAQKKGVRVGIGNGSGDFARLVVIPGMGVYNSMSQLAARANILTQVQDLERMLRKAIKHFSANPQDAEDGSFRLKQKDLSKFSLDKGWVDWWRNKTTEYGMGTIEDLARTAMDRQARGERMLDRDQVMRIAQMVSQEISGEGGINTTPTVLHGNPILRYAMPLVRWPLWMMHAAHTGLSDSNGKQSWGSIARGLSTMAMWNLPLGLAFGLALDKYDEELLGKKTNQPSFDPLAAIPIIGPAAALAVSDDKRKLMNAMIQRAMRAGNIYGLGADVVGQFLLPLDPSTGQRTFSMDSRILFLSQALTLSQGIRNYITQDFQGTWSTVGRPIVMSMGGSSAVHALDLTNKALGLDNFESRLVTRISAQQWLRAAGEQAGIEISRGAGGSTGSSPVSVWTREMAITAMANDRAGFREAFNKARDAAREAVSDNPRIPFAEREKEAMNRLISSWRSRDPREVFKRKPTTYEMQQAYTFMSDDGAQEVREAIQRFESFSQSIVPRRAQNLSVPSVAERRSMAVRPLVSL